ncbi:MAG: DUF5618 family protein [Nitrospinae bacterium]|nr:DUF5618 family protein [Nitrospinota bacterium]
MRYLQNARELLNKSPIEDNDYIDVKYVKEACSTAYLAVLKAIDECLLKRGITEKKLPRSVDGYREALRKHVSIHNGKLLRKFNNLYEELHIAGYYRGNLKSSGVLKELLKDARFFIEKISHY